MQPALTTDRARVLIVDDEPLNLTTLSSLLKHEYRIMVATSGAEALAAARDVRPQLILLDVKMPSMNGYEVCRRLKADDDLRDIPVIFITVLADATHETRAFTLGAVDYIAKPFNPAAVRARVRTHLRLKQQSDLLSEYAFSDGLTGIPNRRAFDEHLRRAWEQGERDSTPLSVLLIDIDFFKRFNDHYGHGAGDDCLARVARTLATRGESPCGMLARYGGEEFIGCASPCDYGAAMALGEQFRAAVAELALPHAHSVVAPVVTISVGVASVRPGARQTAADLVSLADSMLYFAKASGRNAVRGRALED